MGLAAWKDIWLNEGFACYAEWLWSEHSGSISADGLARQYRRQLSTHALDITVGDPGPALMFDDRVYKRGALTLHAVRHAMSDAAFFDLFREWTALHRFGTVTTEDFLALAQQHSPVALDRVFDAWLFGRTLPRVP